MHIYDRIKPTLHVHKTVYRPMEDARMLGRCVEQYAFGKMLDMGTGTGIQGIIGAMKGCEVTFADVNPNAVECARENAATNGVSGKFVVSDLFSNIKGRFNTISFDPPYLRSRTLITGKTNPSTDGGLRGREVIDPFLRAYKRHVMKDHVILMVESWWNDFKEDMERLDAEIVARQHYPLLGDIVVMKFE
ncbi:MAG: methyltransferase [Candidatus Micrarchaeota archaeon]|nr:methyltransferase [Candidatus Micrarchaeota archaeon]